MKKLMVLFICVTTFLVGCTPKKEEMTIRPTTFSEETKNVLKILEEELTFFDICLDESVKSCTISLWSMQDGQWVESGQTSGAINDLDMQIAVRMTDNAYDLYTITKDGYIKYSTTDMATDFLKATGIGSTRLAQSTPIILNQEISLWVRVGTDKQGLSLGDITQDFRNIDCVAGTVVTITFSDKELA